MPGQQTHTHTHACVMGKNCLGEQYTTLDQTCDSESMRSHFLICAGRSRHGIYHKVLLTHTHTHAHTKKGSHYSTGEKNFMFALQCTPSDNGYCKQTHTRMSYAKFYSAPARASVRVSVCVFVNCVRFMTRNPMSVCSVRLHGIASRRRRGWGEVRGDALVDLHV